MTDNSNSKNRFTKTVDYYDQYRPDYPEKIIQILEKECVLNANSVIADIGSGTGKLTKLFLNQGNSVYAVEPNEAMRKYAEQIFSQSIHFKNVNGSAEKTTLADHSIDFVTAAQAFHWFDKEAAKKEFIRILKPSGWVILVWNLRLSESSAFMRAYEQFMQTFGSDDYIATKAENVHIEEINQWFYPNHVQKIKLQNQQIFDLNGLIGRAESMSYLPKQGEKLHVEMINALENIFSQFQNNGKVVMNYQTEIYFGHLA